MSHEEKIVLKCGKCSHEWLLNITLPVLVSTFCAAVPKSCPDCGYKPRSNAKKSLYMLVGEARDQALKRIEKARK